MSHELDLSNYNKLVENAKLALDQGYNHSNILVYDNGMVANFENGNTFDNVLSLILLKLSFTSISSSKSIYLVSITKLHHQHL